MVKKSLSIYLSFIYFSLYIFIYFSPGIYELQTMQLHGAPTVWSKALLEWVQACERARKAQGSIAVGAWSSLLGPRQTAVVLWQHQSPDGCLALADAATTVPEGELLHK